MVRDPQRFAGLRLRGWVPTTFVIYPSPTGRSNERSKGTESPRAVCRKNARVRPLLCAEVEIPADRFGSRAVVWLSPLDVVNQPKADVLRRWSPIQRHHGPRLPMFQRVFLWHCRLTAASSRIPSRDLPAENSNTPAPSQSSTARRP